MKIKHLLLFVTITSSLLAGEILVEETQVLFGGTDNPHFFPDYTQDGQSILITKAAYTGLWILDRASLDINRISDATGSGYEPRSLSNGLIIFRQDEYRKGRKYTSLLQTNLKDTQIIAEAARFVSPANVVNDRLIYLVNETPVIQNGINGQRESSQTGYRAVLNDKLSLKVLKDGTSTTIAPQGDGNYIWAELAPAGDKIVYTKVGQGTYICDLNGNVLTDLGVAHAPKWSPDGNFLVYMDDHDDGNLYTASEIWIIAQDGTQAWMITNTPDRIEMYPNWSPDGNHIIYHTLQGEIIQTTIRIRD